MSSLGQCQGASELATGCLDVALVGEYDAKQVVPMDGGLLGKRMAVVLRGLGEPVLGVVEHAQPAQGIAALAWFVEFGDAGLHLGAGDLQRAFDSVRRRRRLAFRPCGFRQGEGACTE